MDCRPPGSFVHGILQARVLEWDAMLSSRSPRPRYRTCISFISCISRRVLYHQHRLGSPASTVPCNHEQTLAFCISLGSKYLPLLTFLLGDQSQISLGLVITSLECSASAPFGMVPCPPQVLGNVDPRAAWMSVECCIIPP